MTETEWETPRVPPADRHRVPFRGRLPARALADYAALEYPWECRGWFLDRVQGQRSANPPDVPKRGARKRSRSR